MKKDSFLLYIPLYFVFSFVTLATKLKMTPAWFNGTLLSNHKKLLSFQYTNNEQSRVLQFYIPEFFHNLFNIPIIEGYILQRWLFTFLAFVCFHLFLRKWFTHLRSFASVAVLLVILPFTYFNHLQESSSLLMLTFIIGLWAIRESQALVFSLVCFIGVLNNETMLILAILWFFCHIKNGHLKHIFFEGLKTILVCLPAICILAYIRYITWDNPHLGEPLTLFTNLKRISLSLTRSPLLWYKAVYLNIIFVFGAMWIYAFIGLKKKPEFFRRCLYFLPFFIVPHFLTGVIYEIRQMIPIAYIIIPLTLILL